jgi:hypothetical protein
MRAAAVRSLVVVTLAFALLGCEEPKPAKLHMDPSGPFKLATAGAKEQLKVAARDEMNRPWTKPLEVSYASSDEAVAKVAADGTITATGTGDAVITATSGELTSTADVNVRIVGSVEINPGTPTKWSLKKGGQHKLEVTVKDDKGNVMDPQPNVAFSTSNWCIDIDPDGTFRPVSLGKCAAVATVAGQTAQVSVEVTK